MLIKEDGSGKVDANSYANAADGDAYHEAHLYATDWTGATTTTREAALVMATRLIDSLYQFRGFRTHDTQALQWPREYARDDDAGPVAFVLATSDQFFASNTIPRRLVDATIETARELIKADRTADPDGEGLSTFALTGTLSIAFDKRDRRPVISHVAQGMLSKLGEYLKQTAGVVRLIRT